MTLFTFFFSFFLFFFPFSAFPNFSVPFTGLHQDAPFHHTLTCSAHTLPFQYNALPSTPLPADVGAAGTVEEMGTRTKEVAFSPGHPSIQSTTIHV